LEEIATAALAALPVDERQLLEGKYYRRATVRELAGESGLSEKAVESRLLRARAKVKEYILERLKHES
jgi:RNA polymerase sigma factor (sigma-70 family)